MSGAIKQPLQTQYSIHPPSQFICTHLDQLLPDWSCPVRSVLIALQPCGCDLLARSPATEKHKRLLRRQFLQVGYQIATQLSHTGYAVAIFDPRTGSPLFSRPGKLRLDDVAVVQASLGYPLIASHGCSLVLHPIWGAAVYPSILVSSAEPALVEQVMSRVSSQLTPLFFGKELPSSTDQ